MASSILVKILGDSDSLSRAFHQAESAANGFSASHRGMSAGLKLLGIAALGAAAAIGGGFVLALKTGFRELQESEAQLSKASVLIKNLGAATNLTTGDIEKYADQIQSATGLQDDLVMSAENVLLRFESIAGDNGVFRRATQVAADMSVALGKDLPAAAQVLGRALAEPEAAAGKLARIGIVLTAAQKDVIASMVEEGNTAGATAYLLGLLEDKFHGVAEAAGDTLHGKIEKLKRIWEDLSEALATAVLPVATKVLDWMLKIAEAPTGAEKWQIFAEGVAAAFEKLGDLVSKINFAGIASKLASGLASAVSHINWGAVFNIAADVSAALISGLGKAFTGLGQHIGLAMSAAMADVGASVKDTLAGIIDDIRGVIESMGDLPFTDKNLFGPFLADMSRMSEGLRTSADYLRLLGDNARAANKPLTEVAGHEDEFAATGDAVGALASSLKASVGGFTAAEAAAVGLEASIGRIPGSKEVQAYLRDEGFKTEMAALVAKINAMPATKETKAKMLTEEALALIEKYKGKIENVPDKHDTKFTAPGAEDSADKADKVRKHVNDVPDKHNVRFSTTGMSAVVAAASAVAAAVNAVQTSININFTSTSSVHPPPGFAGGVDRSPRGVAIVGEEGPELVFLPHGAEVLTAQDTRSRIAGWNPMTGLLNGLEGAYAGYAGKGDGKPGGSGGGTGWTGSDDSMWKSWQHVAAKKARPPSLGIGNTDATGGNFVPADLMAPPTTIVVNVEGSVIAEKDLIRAVYDGLLAGPGQLNPSLFGGRA